MSDRVFWMLFFLGALALIVMGGLIHTRVEAAMRRHFRRAEQIPLPPQISHCRTIPRDRQETST